MSETPVVEPEVVVVPGAGSSGLTWRRVAGLTPIRVIPVPDEPTVAAMADTVAELHLDLGDGRPRILVGSSLGALVAVELARRVEPKALVLAATGPGIHVAPSLLDWLASTDDALPKVARMSVKDQDDDETVAIALEDLESRGRGLLHRHLTALSRYRFAPPPRTAVPPVVVWGMEDRSVPREDHVRLAAMIGGVVAPVADAGHLPFHEQPKRVAEVIHQVAEQVVQPFSN